MSMAAFLTRTFDLMRPDGAGNLILVQGGIACTPADVVSGAIAQMYPIEKVFKMRQVFTKSDLVEHGDYIDLGGVTYAVQATLPFDAQGGMDAYTELLLEEGLSGA